MNSVERSLAPIIDCLKKFTESDKDKRYRRINNLIGMFSQDGEFSTLVLKNALTLRNKCQLNDGVSAEETASDLLLIRYINDSLTGNKNVSIDKENLMFDSNKVGRVDSKTMQVYSQDPKVTKKEIDKESQKLLQDVLAASLFVANKDLYTEEGKIKYNQQKELRQVEAVVSALEGSHVHMGTGEGKSMVVLTITSIIESLTSDKKDCIVATISSTLLKDINKKTKKILEKLQKNSRLPGLDIEFASTVEKEGSNTLDEELFNNMQKEALLTDDYQYSPEIKKEILKQYWKKRLKDGDVKKDIFEKDFNNPRILFTTERELVFKLSDDPIGFSKAAPKILMDEADIAYNRKSPYVKNADDNLVSKEDVRLSAVNWLFSYVLSHQLTKSDFVYENGSYKLLPGLEGSAKFQLETNLFEEGINIIGEKLGLVENEKKVFAEKAKKIMENNFDKKGTRISEIRRIGHVIGEIFGQEGKTYLFDESEKMQIRDEYTDELLEKHKYQPDINIAILALKNKFEFIQMNETNYSSIKFSTFVKYLKDQLVCFSGTLKYPDPKTKQIKDSNFSKFLRAVTGRKVETIINKKEIKTVPNPYLFNLEETAERKLNDDIRAQTKPTLVIDYEGTIHTKKLFEVIKTSHEQGSDRVVLLPPKPTNKEEEEKYNIFLAKITTQLAEGGIDIIVSSGTAGTGINIVKEDGSFPDLSVMFFGMPENEMELTQGASRRRLEGEDCSWFLAVDQMEKYISYFPETKASKIEVAMGAIDQQKIRELIKESLTNPEKRLDVILEILKQKRRQEGDDDKISIEYDLFYQKFRGRFIKKLYRKLINDFPNMESRKAAFRFMGIPENLYFEIPQIFNLDTIDISSSEYIEKLGQRVFVTKLGRGEVNYIDEQVNIWYDLNVSKAKEFIDLVNFQGHLNSKTSRFGAKIHQVGYDPSQFPNIFSPNKIFSPIDGYTPVILGSGVIGLEKDGKVFLITDGNAGSLIMGKDYKRLSILSLDNDELAVFCQTN